MKKLVVSLRDRNMAYGGRSRLMLAAGFMLVMATVGLVGFYIPKVLAQMVSTSLWPTSARPTITATSDRRAAEVGVKFRSTKAGSVTGLRFYKGSGNTGTHVGSLWSASGQKLASATFRNETSSGWQSVAFSTPVAVNANTTYVASYFAPQGRYAKDSNYFTSSRVSGVLSAPGSDVGVTNGVYRYGSSSVFPQSTSQQSNYWVDVLFSYDDNATTATSGPVASMTLSGASQNSLTLSWTAPTNQGASLVTAYKVGWTETGTGRTWVSTAPHYSLASSPITLAGLSPGTSYDVYVIPINDVGEGTVTTKTASTLPTNTTSASAIVGGYWQMWEGPSVSEITASAPQYNLQYAAFAMGSSTNGAVAFNPVFSTPAQFKTDMAASKTAGSTWLLSIGGGADTTVRLLNETHATTMFNSLVGIIDSYGFQGIDLDIECGSTCWSPSAAASLAQKLKAKYGASFIISATPRPYEARSRTGIYTDFALRAGSNLDLFGLQFYDFPEAKNTAQLTTIINSDLAAITSYGIPASKILIGCITYSKYQYGWNTVSVYKDIYLQQKQKYPELRGVFIWDTSYDKIENWSFAKAMGTAVRGL